MKANGDMFPPQIFTGGESSARDGLPLTQLSSGIDGNALKPDDVVVDVGGSIGTVTLTLLRAFPNLRYVVQDLDTVMPSGEEVRCA